MMNVENLVEHITTLVRGGSTPAQAYKSISIFLPEEAGQAMLKEAVRKFEERTGRIRTLKEPNNITQTGIQGWYPGPSDDDVFWPPLRKYLLKEKGWSEQAVDSVDTCSTKIVSLMQPPGLPEIDTRGLVVGYVQSGKTANFTAVIAKAADVNYKLFIVLSGITDNLRNQTQERLEKELRDLTPHWFALTGPDQDFIPGPYKNVDAFLTDHQQFKILAVVKKNAGVLKRLMKWLSTASKTILNNCPVLIIDDEADQASINAAKYADRRTKINQLILNIINLLPKSAYIGYTATPFANVFIDPSSEDLYPRDFIVSLPKPDGYFGAENIFGRERLWEDDDGGQQDVKLDLIRIIPDDEIEKLQPKSRTAKDVFQPEFTESLEASVRYFFLAAAARTCRGQHHKHMTMLVHTSVYKIVHERFAPLVEDFRKDFLKLVKGGKPEFINDLKQQWENEQNRVLSTDFSEAPISFKELQPYLVDVVDRTEVIIDNSDSLKRLSYPKEEKSKPGKLQIVVGGDTLSRGLTLEGLMVSFFLRSATAYDTLLQMGRWFGYRGGYADLTRMWMTLELAHWFYDLATVEEEIRVDIRRYQDEGLTPLDFGVRVRTHPSMSITSELKMQSAVIAQVGFNNTREQTILFKRQDPEWLAQNIEAVKYLVSAITAAGIPRDTSVGENIIFRAVDSKIVLEFLKRYAFHEARPSLSSETLSVYIQKQNEFNDLLKWNIVIRSAKSDLEPIDFGEGLIVRTVARSRRNKHGPSDELADIGALMSRGDRVIDLNIDSSELKGKKDDDLQKYRPAGLGLLVIYPVAKDSPVQENRQNQSGEPLRLPMDALNHLIGLGIVFPKSKNFVTHTYKTADLSRIPREEVEIIFDEEDQI